MLSCTLIENIHTKFEKTLVYTILIKLNLFFVKVIMPKKANIVGCIYRHTQIIILIILTQVRDYYYSILQKLSKESPKKIFLVGDFNIDLLKFNSCSSIYSVLDELSSSYFTPQILLPWRITGSTKTLIDNIFFNIPQPSEQEQNISAQS